MKLGILETGRPPGDLARQFGDYPDMVSRLLGSEFQIERFDVQNGELPGRDRCHAFLITGSPAGVYEPLPWIGRLLEFIRSSENRKMIGICFGHQAMAQALGGKVEKSHKGWGAGLHHYAVHNTEPWMERTGEIAVPASHQDQVVVQPPATKVIAASEFTPFAALAWTDRPAISFQFHPEFDPSYARALITARYDRVADAERAIASLDAPNDNARVGSWMRRFLKA